MNHDKHERTTDTATHWEGGNILQVLLEDENIGLFFAFSVYTFACFRFWAWLDSLGCGLGDFIFLYDHLIVLLIFWGVNLLALDLTWIWIFGFKKRYKIVSNKEPI